MTVLWSASLCLFPLSQNLNKIRQIRSAFTFKDHTCLLLLVFVSQLPILTVHLCQACMPASGLNSVPFSITFYQIIYEFWSSEDSHKCCFSVTKASAVIYKLLPEWNLKANQPALWPHIIMSWYCRNQALSMMQSNLNHDKLFSETTFGALETKIVHWKQ